MTRDEWIDSMNDFEDLRRFCLDHGYQEDEAYAIISDYDLNNEINEDINAFDGAWQSLRDYLCDIPQGYDWYRRNSSFDYDGLDWDDFRDWRDSVLVDLDETGFFDGEDDNDDEGAGDVAWDAFEDTQERGTNEKPKWMCFATPGDETIPSFETNGVELDALLGFPCGLPA